MAGADYDMIAFDSDGNKCNGILNHEICEVEIIKTYLKVSYRKRIIANIWEGELYLHGLDIKVKRNENSIFVFIKTKNIDGMYKYLAGIGSHCTSAENLLPEFVSWIKEIIDYVYNPSAEDELWFNSTKECKNV